MILYKKYSKNIYITKMKTNSWINFIRKYYSSEKKRSATPKCRYSANFKRVSKMYNCEKKVSNRKTRKTRKSKV